MAILIRGLVGGEIKTTVDWATGDINTIKDMLSKAKAGTLDISSVWSIGQGRVVNYTNTSTTGSSSSEWILTDFNRTTSGGTSYTAWIHSKDLLANSQQMNSSNTNSGGWNSSAMRTNIIPNIYNALPSDFRQLLINGTHIASSGSQSTANKSDTYYLVLHSEKEVQGSRFYAAENENNVCKHLAYFQTANNKKKTGNSGSYPGRWWLRSPIVSNSYSFCSVYSDGSAGYNNATGLFGVSPAAII